MGSFRQLRGVVDTSWSPGGLIESLTGISEIFLFVYSIRRGSLISWSDNARQVLGVDDMALIRDSNLFLRHVHPDDRLLLRTDLENGLTVLGSCRATYRWIRPDNNEVRWIHCRARTESESGEALFRGMLIDLSAEITGPLHQIAGPDSLATVLAAFPSMVFTLDRTLRILRINRPEGMRGFSLGDPRFRSEHFRIGRPFLSCFSDPAALKHFRKLFNELLAGRQESYRTRISEEDSVFNLEILPIRDATRVSGLLCTVSDVSEAVRLERQLSTLQRSEGLRRLAAGVSHNFNNSLQSIIGQASAIRTHPHNTELVQQSSQAIIDIVHRTSALASQLFVFDDQRRETRTPVDVNLVAMAALNRLEGGLTGGVKVNVSFGTPAPVLASQDHLVRALEEILQNARESMAGSGVLTLKTYPVALEEGEIQDLRAGSYAKIVISDHGRGMRHAMRERVFEPFFTTKERDPQSGVGIQGSGLGLSQALAIIREYQGTIVIESQLNAGTTVSVYLPVAESSAEQRQSEALFTVDPRSPPPEILVVDDEPMVLQTAKTILTEAGYSCAVAPDAARALKLGRAHRMSLGLILIDAVMPGMDGPTLLRKLQAILPGVRALGFSGARAELSDSLLRAGAIDIVRKPVDPVTLKRAVAQYLRPVRAA